MEKTNITDPVPEAPPAGGAVEVEAQLRRKIAFLERDLLKFGIVQTLLIESGNVTQDALNAAWALISEAPRKEIPK